MAPINPSLHRKRRAMDNALTVFTWVATAIVLVLLTSILWQVVYHGFSGLSSTLFTQDTPAPGSQGGLRNAIAGSLILIVSATVIATPLGIFAGIYIIEYGRNNRWASFARAMNDLLLSTPSIVAGLFIYTLVVVPLHHFAAWAGTLALTLLAIPIITRSTCNILSLVPQTLREAAIALGAPYWKMVMFVSVRAARTGILTGILLAIARLAGETAPLLFTALNNQFWSLDIQQPIANLPVVIFQFAMSPFPEWQQLAWSGALLITGLILGLSLFTRTLLHLTEHA